MSNSSLWQSEIAVCIQRTQGDNGSLNVQTTKETVLYLIVSDSLKGCQLNDKVATAQVYRSCGQDFMLKILCPFDEILLLIPATYAQVDIILATETSVFVAFLCGSV